MGTITVKAPSERLPGPAPVGRVCAHRGCDTILSTYNEDDVCSMCGGWSLQRMNALEAMGELPHQGGRRRGEVGGALEELMGAVA